jgi:hypothetical protein
MGVGTQEEICLPAIGSERMYLCVLIEERGQRGVPAIQSVEGDFGHYMARKR